MVIFELLGPLQYKIDQERKPYNQNSAPNPPQICEILKPTSAIIDMHKLYNLCNNPINQVVSMSSNLNVVARYKDKNQSAFRVHFYLKNVYYNNENKLTTFLQDTANRISKVVEVSIVQVYGAVRKMVDLSVGLKNDTQATAFMQSHKKILLPGQYGKVVEHEPIYSDLFKTYVKYNQAKQPVSLDTSLIEDKKQEVKDEASQSNALQYRKKNSEEDIILKKLQTENQKHYTLFIFGVPLECKEREVIAVLIEKGIRAKYWEWKYKEDMEYLQVEMQEGLGEKEISSLDLRIEKYPLLVMPKVHEEFINTIIMKLQVELNFQKDIDEVEFMRRADQVGGVVLMIKDEFYGPRKYNVTFNTMSNLMRFQQVVESNYKLCRISKPRYIVRLCRIQKSFTFAQMMQNLHYYDLQLKKLKTLSPESSQY